MAENTLIFADLHLNPFSGKLDEEVLDSLEAAVSKHSPQRMVLAGDTFDLFFDLSHEGERTYAQRLESILDEHSGFVGLAKSIPEIIIIPSQHDQVLIWDEDAIRVLQKGLPNSQTHEYWEHELSNTLVVSGVQLT
jgi:metallophosphoesterase superfamily enzyme